MKEILNFSIINSTNGTVPISILGNNADQMDTANATTKYSWNVTGFTITNENSISLQYSSNNDPILDTVILEFNGTDIQSVVDTLNTLNLGSFFITTSGINTYINNYNQNVYFGQLNIYNNSIPQLNYIWDTAYSGGTNNISVNFVLLISDANPTTSSGNIPIIASDIIDFSGQTDSSGMTSVSVYDETTSTYLYQPSLGAAATFLYSFTALSGHLYTISVVDVL